MTGRLVLLNGASSAGKTTLAEAVAAVLPDPWRLLPVDLFHAVRSRPETARSDWARLRAR